MLARLDWVMLGAVVVLVAYGLWAISGITQHDVLGSPDYYVYRQIVFIAVGTLGMVLAILDRPRHLPPLPEAALPRDTAPLRVRIPGAAPLPAARGAGSTSASSGSSRPSSGSCSSSSPSRASSPTGIAGWARRGSCSTTIALALPPMVLVFIQPDIGSALVYGAALFAVLFVAGIRWLHLAILGLVPPCFCWPSSGGCPRPACPC